MHRYYVWLASCDSHHDVSQSQGLPPRTAPNARTDS
jgi:hypothetical protein